MRLGLLLSLLAQEQKRPRQDGAQHAPQPGWNRLPQASEEGAASQAVLVVGVLQQPSGSLGGRGWLRVSLRFPLFPEPLCSLRAMGQVGAMMGTFRNKRLWSSLKLEVFEE